MIYIITTLSILFLLQSVILFRVWSAFRRNVDRLDQCRTQNAKLKLAADGGGYQKQIAKQMEAEHGIVSRNEAKAGAGETRV